MSKIFKASAINIDNDNKLELVVSPALADDMQGEDSPEHTAWALVHNAEREATHVLAKARDDAIQIMREASEQAAEDAAKAMQESRESGYQTGYAEAEAEGNRIIAEAQKTLADAIAERDKMRLDMEPEMVTLIIEIARKLLDDEIALNPQAVVCLVRKGFAGATLTGDVTVRVSPEDYEQVVAQRDAITALTDGSAKWEPVKDLSLHKMDCVIETPYGNIDCSLDQQFEALRRNLMHILERH